MRRRILFGCALAGTLAFASAQAVEFVPEGLPRYEPKPVAFPRGASYLTPTGAIAIVGYNDMKDLLEAVDRLFLASHPEFHFALDLPGTRQAPPALARGATAFAPMGAEFTASQLQAYRRTAAGPDPVAIRVAHASISPRAKSGPLLIVVNPANPLERLTVEEVARIFSTAGTGDDLTVWGQLHLSETWSNCAIHPIGLAAETPLGESMLAQKMPGRHFRPGFRAEVQSEDVVRQVAEDPSAIGFSRANVVRPNGQGSGDRRAGGRQILHGVRGRRDRRRLCL